MNRGSFPSQLGKGWVSCSPPSVESISSIVSGHVHFYNSPRFQRFGYTAEVCKQLLESPLGLRCYLHLIRSRNGRMSDLAQSGLETEALASSCKLLSSGRNCGFPAQPVFGGGAPGQRSSSETVSCILPLDNYCNMKQACMPRKSPCTTLLSMEICFQMRHSCSWCSADSNDVTGKDKEFFS